MKKWLIAVILIALVAVGFFAYRASAAERQAAAAQSLETVQAERGPLTATIGATGVVRANQTAVLSWQASGTVGEVNVEVGEQVAIGDILASLEDTSLPQNIILAQADLVAAQRALEDLSNSQVQRATAQKAVEDAQKALEDASNPELVQAQAMKAVTDAQKAVEEAERLVRSSQSPASQSYIDAAESEVIIARDRLERAQERFKPYEGKSEDNLTRAQLQSELAAAQQVYDAAVRKLNSLQGTASDTDQAVRQANLEAAQAQLLEAQREYERVKDGPSQTDLGVLQAQLEDAQREFERVKDGPSAEDVQAAQARIDAAQATINLARLTAPFNGIVTQVSSIAGDQTIQGLQAFRLDDLSRLLVDVSVSEVDINRVEVGQNATLTFDAILGKEYHGVVDRVALVGTADQGVVDFTVTVVLTDADESVLPGMTAAVNIVTRELEDVLLVPNRAVRVVEGERVVYVLEDGAPQAVNVSLGASSEANSEVLDGELKEGDAIILNPPTVFDQSGPPPFVRR